MLLSKVIFVVVNHAHKIGYLEPNYIGL